MKLYVMRHGPAEDDAPSGRDADRALTPSGRDRTRSVARALVTADEAPVAIVSSPLVRALQTAEIVAAIAGVDRVEVRREMAPGGDTMLLAAELLQDGRKRVMVVGHEPDLSDLVERLVGQPPPQGMLKAMVVGVRLVPSAPGPGGGSGGGDAAADGRGFNVEPRFVLDPKTLEWQRG
jgi:phosphohistidine phosphatase